MKPSEKSVADFETNVLSVLNAGSTAVMKCGPGFTNFETNMLLVLDSGLKALLKSGVGFTNFETNTLLVLDCRLGVGMCTIGFGL